MKQLIYKKIPSPVGLLTLVSTKEALVAILWDNDKPTRVKLDQMEEKNHHPFLLKVETQLNEYFDQKRKVFDFPLELIGTPFQKAVWNLLYEIPYGITCSYQDIAKKAGNPKAVRAVGGAVGHNPISIIVPCHRVIGSNGKLTGFAGGLHRKEILLKIEH